MYWIGLGAEVVVLNSQVVPISQVVLNAGFTVFYLLIAWFSVSKIQALFVTFYHSRFTALYKMPDNDYKRRRTLEKYFVALQHKKSDVHVMLKGSRSNLRNPSLCVYAECSGISRKKYTHKNVGVCSTLGWDGLENTIYYTGAAPSE